IWNKQRTDEVLLDVDDVALGHTSVHRWNPTSKWVTSAQPAREPLVDQQTFDRVQLMFTTRGPRSPRSPRTSLPYLFKGLLHCGICARRMQGHRSHGESYYRCRRLNNRGLADCGQHPPNVYLREDALAEPVDAWLATAFDPPTRATTIDALYDAQDDGRT